MSNIHFEPWIGNNYWDGGCFEKKILVQVKVIMDMTWAHR